MRALIFGGLAFAVLSAGAFQVVETDGRFSVCDGARVVISDVTVIRGDKEKLRLPTIRFSGPLRVNGARVWNRWDETPDGRVRLEIVEHAGGAIEITMMGQVDPFDKLRSRRLELRVPHEIFASSGKCNTEDWLAAAA